MESPYVIDKLSVYNHDPGHGNLFRIKSSPTPPSDDDDRDRPRIRTKSGDEKGEKLPIRLCMAKNIGAPREKGYRWRLDYG